MEPVRTRIAPSPTGFPHLGTIYSSLFSRAIAKKHNGQFIWRSEDTDRTRYILNSEESLQKAFEWFNLEPDESPFKGGNYGPYRQSERLELYKKYAEELIKKGHAYYAFDTPERLTELRKEQIKNKQQPMYDRAALKLSKEEIQKKLDNNEDYVIRLKVPKNQEVVCFDEVRGEIKIYGSTIDDQVLIKSDGYPTYHLAVVVDDHLMKITHVVRASEWLPSFPKQVLLYKFLGWDLPKFIHIPSIQKQEGKGKLSKRDGTSSVEWYKVRGYLPEAVINYLSLLGFSHPEEKDIFTNEEFIRVFSIDRILKQLPKFDEHKLDWVNGQYIKALSEKQLTKTVIHWLESSLEEGTQELDVLDIKLKHDLNEYSQLLSFLKKLDSNTKLLFMQINKERVKKFEDLFAMNQFFYSDDIEYDSSLLTKHRTKKEVKEHLIWVKEKIESTKIWELQNLKSIESEIASRAKELEWKVIEVFAPIRIAITKQTVSPPLFESCYIMGKERCLENISLAIQKL